MSTSPSLWYMTGKIAFLPAAKPLRQVPHSLPSKIYTPTTDHLSNFDAGTLDESHLA